MCNDKPLKSPYEETDERKIAKDKADKYKTDEALRHSPAFDSALRLILKEGFDPTRFGDRLYAARKEAKISQKELGKVIGVSGVSISSMERGRSGNGTRRSVTVEQLKCFCRYLNVTPEYLLGFVDGPTERIVPDNLDPYTVLQAWSTKNNCISGILDPVFMFDEATAASVKFVIGQLWNQHFKLLINFYQLSKHPILSYDITCQLLHEYLLKGKEYPILPSNFSYDLADDIRNPCIRKFYRYITRSGGEPEPKTSDPAIKGHIVYRTIADELMRSGQLYPPLLKEFVKAASLPDDDKTRLKLALDPFVRDVLGH